MNVRSLNTLSDLRELVLLAHKRNFSFRLKGVGSYTYLDGNLVTPDLVQVVPWGDSSFLKAALGSPVVG